MKDKNQKPNYIPKDYETVDNIDREKYSEEEINEARKSVEEHNKRVKGLSVLSMIWTCLSTIYAIASTIVLLARRWVENTVSYVLIGILVLYVGMFIGVAVAAFANPKAGKKPLKGFKTALKFLKPIMSIVLVALAITELVGIASDSLSIPKIVFMVATILIAAGQLAIRIWLACAKIKAKKVAKGFKVRIERYVDGKKKKKSVVTKIKEKQFSDD